MEHGSARELLRASATDADAVRQYLQSIDADELNGLLDGITPRDAKCASKGKKKNEFVVQDDWLPLVHLLVQCESTRLRAASRIIQVLRRGTPSELESMQLLTEINLSYSSALDELQELKKKMQRTQLVLRRKKLLDEILVVLDIIFSFLEEVVDEAKPSNSKVLPQLLGLVPYFLNMMEELSDEMQGASNLAKLLELPWSCQTVPSLLDVLVEDSSLMSRESWRQLQENVERMVTTSPELASEMMNSLIRECVLVANVSGDHKWISIARYLLRQLPVHLRQEAEFNLQMSFNQSPRIVSLVCESIRSCKLSEDHDTIMKDSTSLFDDSDTVMLDLKIDWHDLFVLLHCLQASKPILHHRTSSSRVATEAAVFTDIEQLAWWIVQSDFRIFETHDTGSRILGKTLEKHALDQVELLLNYGGKQIHSREWKALLLMDIAVFWIEQSNSARGDDKIATSKPTLALTLLQAIFETAPETRTEVLSCLFEHSQKPAQRKIAEEAISKLFISQSGKLFPHLNAIQDWLSMQFQRSFDSAREFFLITSRLATVYKDLYNFLMIFLRKLLSTSNLSYQRFAVDMWCTWLDRRLPFNEQQEEEIISALKSSIVTCHEIQAWSFGRIEQMFHCCDIRIQEPAFSLRRNSWEELHRFLSQEVGKFIEPTSVDYKNEADGDSADEYEDEDSGLTRFRFRSLDMFYQQNASLDGAASIGLAFQKLLSCVMQFQKAALQSEISSEGLSINSLSEKESDVKQWLVDLVSNWKYFFHWICQDSDDLLNQSTQGRNCDKSAWWRLVARIYIACGICNIVIEMLMGRPHGGRDKDNQEAVAFHADEFDISVWSLMEVEFCLHRMLQKLGSHYGNEMGTSVSKDYTRAASYGLHRVLHAEKFQFFTAINNFLRETVTPQHDRSHGMSFNTVLFALDSCYSTVGNGDLFGAFYPQDTEIEAQNEAGCILGQLLSVYINIRDRIVTASNFSGADNIDNLSHDGDSERDESVCTLQFSLYADSISSKFPISARHLVAPGKSAKTVVLVDAKEGEEMLEHICAAVGRTLDVMFKTTNLQSMHAQLGDILRNLTWGGQNQQSKSEDNSNGNNFVRLARYFLSDVKDCVQLDGLTKLSISCASLSKRLRDIAAETEEWNAVCADSHVLSSLAYDVLCDNVVFNPRLLRLLMNICLPIHLALQIKTFVTLESKLEGIVQACGINTTEKATTSTNTSEDHRQRRPYLKKQENVIPPARRKRLRQGFDARSPYDLKVNSDSDSDSSYFSDSDISAQSDHISPIINFNTNGATPIQDRIPHLQSHANQAIAILSVLAVLEQAQSTLLSAITAKNSNSEPCSFLLHQEILAYIRIHELVNKAVIDNSNFSCSTRKVLLKVIHMIELDLRIGKISGVLRNSDELGLSNNTTIYIYKFSVTSASRSRTWVDSIKDVSQDPGIKTKVSSTLLKMDIFFLQVPGTVQTWLKETTISDEAKERLKALVVLIKEKIAPTNQTNVRCGKAKARQRLLGVVPIIRKRRKRLRSRHPIIDAFLNEEDGADAFADLEDFIE